MSAASEGPVGGALPGAAAPALPPGLPRAPGAHLLRGLGHQPQRGHSPQPLEVLQPAPQEALQLPHPPAAPGQAEGGLWRGDGRGGDGFRGVRHRVSLQLVHACC